MMNVIDAPSLETLAFQNCTAGFCVLENEMPNIVKAHTDLLYSHSWKILGSITAVKVLHLCLSSSEVF